MSRQLLAMTLSCSLMLAAAEAAVHPIATPETPDRFRMAEADAAIKAPGFGGSLLWKFDRIPELTITPVPADLLYLGGAENNALELWLYGEHPQDTSIMLVVGSDNPGSKGEDCFSCRIPLDFTGWKRLVIPFTEMKPILYPLGWDRVDRLSLRASRPEGSLRVGRIGVLAVKPPPGPRLQDEEFYRELAHILPLQT